MQIYPAAQFVKSDALDALALNIRLNNAAYTRQSFTEQAERAVQSAAGMTARQAHCIISGALEHRSDWTLAKDWGNLLEEINWYCILHASILRNAN